jgi:TRAP-type C4-dicarboxylate transport system permease small subunit
VRALARAGRAVALAEGVGLGGCLAALVGLATWQFGARNLRGFGVPPAPLWIDSALRHSLFFIGFLGAAFATHAIKHLRVDAVSRLLPVRARLALRVATTLLAAAVCLALLRAGWMFHADIASTEVGDVSQEGDLINATRGSLALPLGFGLVLFHLLVQAVLDVAWIGSGEEPPAEWLSESHGGEISSDDPRAAAIEAATVMSEEL